LFRNSRPGEKYESFPGTLFSDDAESGNSRDNMTTRTSLGRLAVFGFCAAAILFLFACYFAIFANVMIPNPLHARTALSEAAYVPLHPDYRHVGGILFFASCGVGLASWMLTIFRHLAPI
jgi:hypothetical protein